MKMFVDRLSLPTELPVDLNAVKQHLRVDGSDQDQAITTMAHTAALDVMGFAEIALLTQTIRVVVLDLSPASYFVLPIGPVPDGEVPTVAFDGSPVTGFTLLPGHIPTIIWDDDVVADRLTRLEITYQAGFGSSPSDIPNDLAQAIMDQTALHYDGRSPMSQRELTMSPHMTRVAARYRGVRL